jgi:hypothetical protein
MPLKQKNDDAEQHHQCIVTEGENGASKQVQSFAARGFGFQVLMVIPELELVVAINSNGYEETDDQANQVFELIANFILPALE